MFWTLIDRPKRLIVSYFIPKLVNFLLSIWIPETMISLFQKVFFTVIQIRQKITLLGIGLKPNEIFIVFEFWEKKCCEIGLWLVNFGLMTVESLGFLILDSWFIWTPWTSLSAVRERLLNLITHSLILDFCFVYCYRSMLLQSSPWEEESQNWHRLHI